MKNQSHNVAPRVRALLLFGVATALGAMACNGAISDPGQSAGGAPSGAAGSTGGAIVPDVGRISIHRLNNLEYDNTMRDLVGVDAMAQKTFQSDETGEFDNDADAFTMNDARYEQYFDAADALVDAAFADATLSARILTCAPAFPTDTACATQIVEAFGLRAWRRPLTDDEVTRFVQLSVASMAAGKDFGTAMKIVVKTMLSSLSFLYRIEYDADPTSLVPHPLGPYELASRLSYWMWSTMPDAELFARAADGTLSKPAVLAAELDRLLADARSETFVQSFAGQWLGVRELDAHEVDPGAFPSFDETLRAAMEQEMYAYFDEFVRNDRPFDQFLTADVNFVNAPLARHYGMDATGLGDTLVRVEDTTDARKGFLGLAGWLTATAYSYYTDIETRGHRASFWLLCASTSIPTDAVHDDVPDLTQPPKFVPETKANRDAIVAISGTPACATCHEQFDPIGVGLEEFDAIGALRTHYGNGDPIDTRDELADGTMFTDERSLADLLSRDPRLLSCAVQTALTYALGREVGYVDSDKPFLAGLGVAWRAQGLTLHALLKLIALDDTFRLRRGEANP